MNPEAPQSPDPTSPVPAKAKFRRYDMRKLLADPELRRKLIVQSTIATQAREGIDVSEAEAEDSYYVVTQAERAAFLGLVPFRSEAGENDERHVEFVRALSNSRGVRSDIVLKDFTSIDDAPLAYGVLSLIGPTFRMFPPLQPSLGIARQGKATGDDPRWLRYHWETVSVGWVPYSKGGEYARFYKDTDIRINWKIEERDALKASGNGLPSEELYFLPGITWPRRTNKGVSVRRLPSGCIFGDKSPVVFVTRKGEESYALGILNSAFFEFLFKARTSYSWEVGIMKGMPFPQGDPASIKLLSDYVEKMEGQKSYWDTGNEVCTRFNGPWVLQSSSNKHARTLSVALNAVLDKEVVLDAELTATYSQLNDAVYRLYGVNETLRSKIEASIGERPPEVIWPQMEGKDRDQKRREHVDRLLTYLVKQILIEDEDHLVCLQRVAHEPPLLERLREKLAACFPEQDPSALETEVINELKKKTKGYHRAESLAEWLHDVFFETHNALYQQRPLIWHLASSQTRTEPGFACLVHAHHFDADALAKLRSVYIRDRIAVLKREAAQAGNDGKADLRLDLLALAEEVEAYDAKLALLQEGSHTGPEGGDRDYRILTPWKTPETRPQGWHPDVDDGIKVNLAPLARTILLRRRLKVGESKDED